MDMEARRLVYEAGSAEQAPCGRERDRLAVAAPVSRLADAASTPRGPGRYPAERLHPADDPTVDPPGCPGWWTEHWKPQEWWDDEKIEAALCDFIGDRDEWPTQWEFTIGL